MAIFGVNLKRFDVHKDLGGICLEKDPFQWINDIVNACVNNGLGEGEDPVILFPPENAVYSAKRTLVTFPKEKIRNIFIGTQGVHMEDVKTGGNFGAFTTNLPAAAASSMGLSHTLIGHSEERKYLTDLYNLSENRDQSKGATFLNTVLKKEILCALRRALKVVICVGETLEERGEGPFNDAQKENIKQILGEQLYGICDNDEVKKLKEGIVAIAYEPRWAIGPGRTPPGPEYIGFVADFIKDTLNGILGLSTPVLYGGGLKRENAADIGRIPSIGGGLVALTKFTDPIAFDPGELKVIIDLFTGKIS